MIARIRVTACCAPTMASTCGLEVLHQERFFVDSVYNKQIFTISSSRPAAIVPIVPVCGGTPWMTERSQVLKTTTKFLSVCARLEPKFWSPESALLFGCRSGETASCRDEHPVNWHTQDLYMYNINVL